MAKLIHIIDPGAMEGGGHHFALVETLLASGYQGDVQFHTHRHLDLRVCEKIQFSGYSLNLAFGQNFYEYFGVTSEQDSGSALSYIAKLQKEYRGVLDQVAQTPGQHLCFYPCVDWTHLFSLRLALEGLSCETLEHRICLMFDFGVNPDASFDIDKATDWLPQLRWAVDHPQIKLYAADSKVINAWQIIFPNEPLEVMPSYLAYWPNVPSRGGTDDRHRILAYTGDVKADKGFNQLADVVLGLLQKYSSAEVIVQFTWNWEMSEFEVTRERLKRIANDNPRFKLYDQPWWHNEFAAKIASCSAYYCTYDKEVYDNKSSGLPVWLGYYGLELLGEKPKALARELDYQRQHASYKKMIYTDLLQWFLN